jgi:hypothetical protein
MDIEASISKSVTIGQRLIKFVFGIFIDRLLSFGKALKRVKRLAWDRSRLTLSNKEYGMNSSKKLA